MLLLYLTPLQMFDDIAMKKAHGSKMLRRTAAFGGAGRRSRTDVLFFIPSLARVTAINNCSFPDNELINRQLRGSINNNTHIMAYKGHLYKGQPTGPRAFLTKTAKNIK